MHLGKSFANMGTAGDRIRAALKSTFVKIVDLAIEEKADLVILAGDTFDNIDVSHNFLDFFVSQIGRLGDAPVIILPGARDNYQRGSFWDEWGLTRQTQNLYPLTDTEKPYIELGGLSTTIYGYPILAETKPDARATRLKRFGRSNHHVAVIYGTLVLNDRQGTIHYPIYPDDIINGGFDYTAFGGNREYQNLSPAGIAGAYPGSPEVLSAGSSKSGHVVVIELGTAPTLKAIKVGELEWVKITIPMETVSDADDLRQKINEKSGPNVIMEVTFKGLALLESGFDVDYLRKELAGNFLYLDIVDRSRVLPENVSEVKVQEKTILGQYLRVMVDKLKKAEGANKNDLEESLKVGYTLLTGKEHW